MNKAVSGHVAGAGTGGGRPIIAEVLEDRRLFASVAGLVFSDVNGDGVRQSTEPAVSGRQVFVDLNADGSRQSNEPIATTAGNGSYKFASLKAGKYMVRQLLPAGSEQTSPGGASTAAATINRAAAAGTFKLEINPGPKLSANPAALAAARAAAAAWSKVFADPVTVRVDVELQRMGFGEVLGATNATKVNVPYDQVRDALVASLAPDEAFARSLPARASLKYRLPTDEVSPFHFDGVVSANRANLLALGFLQTELDGPRSLYKPAVVSDGTVDLNSDNAFDYDRSNGISPGKDDFYATVLHELGHVLGFQSAIDVVDLHVADPGGERKVLPAPLDLFRLKPGAGSVGFGSAQRQWVSGRDQAVQVFYDGVFDPTGIKGVAGLKRGDVPMSTGLVTGDNEQASHWKDDAVTKRFLGIMDPTLDRTFSTPAANDVRALGLIGWDVRRALPGRAVTVATATASVSGQNFGVRPADDDDQLAEARTVAVGQTVSGQSIASARDVDVYAIRGKAGEWFELDVDAASGFDSYLRVLSADGKQLAANDNAAAPGETLGKSSYLRFTLPRDGTYYLAVSGKGNAAYDVYSGGGKSTGSTGGYTLSVKNATFDDDATLKTARAIKVGQTVSGAISPSRDVDLYKFTVTAGQKVSFDIDFPAGSKLDSFLRLFDAAGHEIEVSDDQPAQGEDWTFESYIEHRFGTAGTYYVGVSATGNDRYDPVAGTNKVDGPGGAYNLIVKLV